ncbi:MAG: hypothetical protein US76_03290 [Parcubacteria group bacterium GW2011_GWA2_38_13b]|nr:MAG: hypothetical protein US76_03290 [Parcubacteria group bacterium GW2011_GWA2_38_13b]
MVKKFVFIFVFLMIPTLLSHGFMDYESNRLVSYNTGKIINVDLSDAKITNAKDEKPEIVEKLKKIENELSQNEDWAESVWMILVSFKPNGGYYEPPGVKFSFGSCVSISPTDPAFKMDEYDMDEMKNHGVNKKNYDAESSYMDTNFHVVSIWSEEDKLPLEIKKIFRTKSGEEKIVSYPAKLVGTIPREDYAVLKIERTKIPSLPMGNLEAISDFQKKYGYPVMIIGSPYILEGTITEGKIFHPSLHLGNHFQNLFGATADMPLNEERNLMVADVNPGNSGGVTVGMTGENKGKIIGKPCSGYPGSRIAFSIPDYIIKELFPLILTKKIHTPYYSGLIMANPKTAMKDPINIAFFDKLGLKSLYFEVENTEGVLVVGFMDDSPLKAKTTNPYVKNEDDPNSIKYGDIITAINNKETKTPNEFLKVLRATKDEKVEIKATRFVSHPENGNEIWEKQEVVISKTKKEMTLTGEKYKILYQKVKNRGFSALFEGSEMRGMEIPFRTELHLLK